MNSQSVHYKRRPTIDPIQEQKWIALMNDLISTHHKCERLLNCDETTRRIDLPGMKPWPKLEAKMSRHTLMEIRRIADQLGTYLVFILAEITDAYRPLDRSFFGAMRRGAGECTDFCSPMTFLQR
jgi:hypothetical protein